MRGRVLINFSLFIKLAILSQSDQINCRFIIGQKNRDYNFIYIDKKINEYLRFCFG